MKKISTLITLCALPAFVTAQWPSDSQDIDARRIVNDGDGSGLDADLFDGVDSIVYARIDQQEEITGSWTLYDISVGDDTGDSTIEFRDNSEPTLTYRVFGWNEVNQRFELEDETGSLYEVLHRGNENTVDAGTLDTIDSSQFARRDAPNTFIAANSFSAPVTLQSNSGTDSVLLFVDSNSSTSRSLMWDDSDNEWYVEDDSGTLQKMIHSGNFNVESAGDGGNADLLDGIDSTQFTRNDIEQTIDGTLWTLEDELRVEYSGSLNEFTYPRIVISEPDTTSEASVMSLDIEKGVNLQSQFKTTTGSNTARLEILARSNTQLQQYLSLENDIIDIPSDITVISVGSVEFSGSNPVDITTTNFPQLRIDSSQFATGVEFKNDGDVWRPHIRSSSSQPDQTQFRLEVGVGNPVIVDTHNKMFRVENDGILSFESLFFGKGDFTGPKFEFRPESSPPPADVIVTVPNDAGGELVTTDSDGAGSGVDADLLHGVSGLNYARRDLASETFSGTLDIKGDRITLGPDTADGRTVIKNSTTTTQLQREVATSGFFDVDVLTTDGLGDIAYRIARSTNTTGNVETRFHRGDGTASIGVEVRHKTGEIVADSYNTWSGEELWTDLNDGVGSGLDADLLDSLDSSDFARSSGATALGMATIEANTYSGYGLTIEGDGGGSNTLDSARINLIRENPNRWSSITHSNGVDEVWYTGMLREGGGVPNSRYHISTTASPQPDGTRNPEFQIEEDTGDVGINRPSDSVGAKLHVGGDVLVDGAITSDSGNLNLRSSGNTTSLFTNNGTKELSIQQQVTSGNSVMSFNALANDNVSDATYRFGRGTNTTGPVQTKFLRGDGANSTQIVIDHKAPLIRPWVGIAADLGTISDPWTNVYGANFITDGSEVWHPGNDGSGSGLDADTLDGTQGSNYVNTFSGQTINGTKVFTNPVLQNTRHDRGYIVIEPFSNDPANYDDGSFMRFFYAGNDSNGNPDEHTLYSAHREPDGFGGTQANDVDLVWNGNIQIGPKVSGEVASILNFRDNAVNNVRSLRWQPNQGWQIESSGGVLGKLWHEGNDGSGSDLDADTLDGLQGSAFVRTDGSTHITGNQVILDSGLTAANTFTGTSSTFNNTSDSDLSDGVYRADINDSLQIQDELILKGQLQGTYGRIRFRNSQGNQAGNIAINDGGTQPENNRLAINKDVAHYELDVNGTIRTDKLRQTNFGSVLFHNAAIDKTVLRADQLEMINPTEMTNPTGKRVYWNGSNLITGTQSNSGTWHDVDTRLLLGNGIHAFPPNIGANEGVEYEFFLHDADPNYATIPIEFPVGTKINGFRLVVRIDEAVNFYIDADIERATLPGSGYTDISTGTTMTFSSIEELGAETQGGVIIPGGAGVTFADGQWLYTHEQTDISTTIQEGYKYRVFFNVGNSGPFSGSAEVAIKTMQYRISEP